MQCNRGRSVNFKEKLSRRSRVYTGKAIHFSVDEIILPDGNKATREYVEHPGAVAVIPFIDNNQIILVKQYRYPVGAVTWEIPAGKLNKGEKPLSCVKRELAEEAGYRPRKIKKMVSFWPTPAFANEVIHIFVAHDLVQVQASPDQDEFIETETVRVKTALQWIKSGRIQDSKTIIALLYWAQFFSR
jgi:ADP-ribose pyrophosphatase